MQVNKTCLKLHSKNKNKPKPKLNFVIEICSLLFHPTKLSSSLMNGCLELQAPELPQVVSP